MQWVASLLSFRYNMVNIFFFLFREKNFFFFLQSFKSYFEISLKGRIGCFLRVITEIMFHFSWVKGTGREKFWYEANNVRFSPSLILVEDFKVYSEISMNESLSPGQLYETRYSIFLE